MTSEPLELLQRLVSIPSVNPMGRPARGDIYFEERVTRFLESWFQTLGVRYQTQEIAPRRQNIAAWIPGRFPADTAPVSVVFEAHQDTVPVEGMAIPPFDPQLRDGRLYGRGACDVKGGMASMLTAFKHLAEQRPTFHPTVIMACSVDEEFAAQAGAGKLNDLWTGPNAPIPDAPAFAVVAEPTLLDVVIAHKGAVRWKCEVHGKAAHSSQPQAGDNAIYRMARVVSVLETYARTVVGTLAEHPILGRPTLSVGLIEGGISVNTVPDRCTIDVDRRSLPGENHEAVQQHVIQYVRQQLPDDAPFLSFSPPYLMSRALSDADNGVMADRLQAVIRQHGAAGNRIGVNFGTDAPALAANGIPTVVFGPGDIRQAHTVDEWIEVEQLGQATRILEDLVRQWYVPYPNSGTGGQ